jgi:hypothetical protein
MAGRTEQNNASFFPFFCKYGDCMNYLHTKYKNDGFATWVKILRELTIKDYHFLDLRNRKRMMALASNCLVSEEVLLDVVSILVEFEELDRDIWEQHQTIWNQKFINSLDPLYDRRKNKCIKKDELIEFLSNNAVINSINDYINTQSKEKKSKVEKSKEKITPEGEQKKDTKGMYFFIGKDSFKYQPSKHFLEHESMEGFREIFATQRLSKDEKIKDKQLAEVCEEFDKKYACCTFSNDNHFKNSINKIQENLSNGKNKQNTSNQGADSGGYKKSSYSL